jgi:hypothetical protein
VRPSASNRTFDTSPGGGGGGPETQIPAWQVSFIVQAPPSSHGAPSGFGGSEQIPVAGLHAPGSWQPSLAVHTTEAPPAQAPA